MVNKQKIIVIINRIIFKKKIIKIKKNIFCLIFD